jgi:hypothetical protein
MIDTLEKDKINKKMLILIDKIYRSFFLVHKKDIRQRLDNLKYKIERRKL